MNFSEETLINGTAEDMEESKKEPANKGKEKERKQTVDVDEPAGNTAGARLMNVLARVSTLALVPCGRLGYSGRTIKQALRKGSQFDRQTIRQGRQNKINEHTTNGITFGKNASCSTTARPPYN